MVSTDEHLYYITGFGPNWKKTEIPQWTLTQPPELILIGTALSPGGKFCVLLEDYPANSLVLECLASLK
jgi:hypothetical protein